MDLQCTTTYLGGNNVLAKDLYQLQNLYFPYWAAKQQTSWVIAPWCFSVSSWRICITFVWPRGSLKLTVPSSRSERHLHFASIRLCLALLFIISIDKKKYCFSQVNLRGWDICFLLTNQVLSEVMFFLSIKIRQHWP